MCLLVHSQVRALGFHNEPCFLLVCACLLVHPQVGALADVMVQLPELETLLLAGNDLDDQAFELLGSQVRVRRFVHVRHAHVKKCNLK